MITAQKLEVRAGARLLMEDVTFRVAAGDKVGLVGRNGAGKTTLTKILAGEAPARLGRGARAPARSATCRRTRAPATPRCSPATGSCPRAASTTSYAGCAQAEVDMGSEDPTVRERGDAALRRADAELHAGGGYAAESEAAPDRRQPRHRGADPRPAARDPLGRPAPSRRAGPDPVLRRRDPAPRRADQPPRRRLDRVAARLPQGPQGRVRRDQPRQRAARGRPSTRSSTSTPTAAEIDVYNMGWKQLPHPARDRRAAPQARAGQRREQGQDPHRPGQQDARQGHQGPGRAVDAQARREDDGRPRGRARGRQGRPDQVPRPGAVRQDAAHGRGAVEVLRLAGGLHRRRPGHRQGLAGRHPRPQRRRQDHDAAHPGRRRRARHRRGRARPRAQGRLLRPGARDPRHRPHGAGEHADRRARSSPTPRRASCSARSSSPATTPTSPPRCSPVARRPGSPWPASWSPAPTCCCSTSPPTTSTRPPARRCWPRSAPTRARSSWSPTTRARCARSSPTGCCCCPTATRTCGTTTTPTWSRCA